MRIIPYHCAVLDQQLADDHWLHRRRAGYHRERETRLVGHRGYPHEVQATGLPHRSEESARQAQESTGQDHAGEFRGLRQQEAE